MSLLLFCVFSLWYCLVVKFTLLFSIYPFRKFDSARSNDSKVQNLVAPLQGAPILVPPNFFKFYLFILAVAKKLMCTASVVKKFEFWQPCFGGNPHFGTPKLWSNIIFLFVFAYLKHFMFPAEKIKKFEFWKAPFGRNPHFLLGLVYFEYLPIPTIWYIYLKKFKSLKSWLPHFKGTTHFSTPKFCYILSFFHICLHSKFCVFSMSGQKVSILAASFEGKTQFWDPKIFSNFVFPLFWLNFNTSCVKL